MFDSVYSDKTGYPGNEGVHQCPLQVVCRTINRHFGVVFKDLLTVSIDGSVPWGLVNMALLTPAPGPLQCEIMGAMYTAMVPRH